MKWLTLPLVALATMVSVPEPSVHTPVAFSMTIPIPPPEPPTRPSPPPAVFAPIVGLSLGDSLTLEPSYRPEFSRLATKTGQPLTWVVQAAPGSKCSWWLDKIDGLITQYHPNIIILNCGTNDTPTDDTEGAYRFILATATNRNTQIVASLIGVPDMLTATNSVRPYISDWMYNTNLAIKRALVSYPNVRVADFRRIPHTIEWLQTDGIHWTNRANVGAAQILYQAVATSRGWKTFGQMSIAEMCGLNGTDIGAPELIPNVDYRMCGP